VSHGALEPHAAGSFDLRLVTTTAADQTTDGVITTVTYKLLPAGGRFAILRLDSPAIVETAAAAR